MAKEIKRAGGKFTRSHTSVIPVAVKMVDLLNEMPEVKKISLGIIKAGKPSGGKRRIKIKKRPVGFLMTVRGNNSIQEISIYTSEAEKVVEKLKKETAETDIDIEYLP
ncbi:MAG: DUF2103 domain-containing protein [Patescibacteria group bacterium]